MIFLLFILLIFSFFGCDLVTKDSGTSFTIIPLEEMEISAGTGEKPQSKVWYHDSCWWAVLPNQTGTKLWQLENNKWTSKLHLSDSPNIKADTKAIGNLAHILLYQGAETELASLEYDTVSKTSATKRISFGSRHTIIIGEESINNVSSTKQNISNEILILASESGTAKGVCLQWSSNSIKHK